MELHQLHPIFTLWATTEPELESILLAMAKSIEANATAHKKLLDSIPCEEKEYVAYIEAVKDALSRRNSMQIEYEMTVDELSKKRLEKEQVNSIFFLFIFITKKVCNYKIDFQLLNASPTQHINQGWGGSIWKSETRDEKLEKLDQLISRLIKDVEVLQDRLECANENLHSDLERWNIEKRKDLKNMLIAMSDQHICHYQECVNAWEDILEGIKIDNVVSEELNVKLSV